MEKITVPAEAIDLDLQNPRTGSTVGQKDALRTLLSMERDGDKVFALAADIASVGMLDPGDRLYVIRAPKGRDRYIALDGNRRVAALRLLNNSVLAEDPAIGLTSSMRLRFKRLRNDPASKWPASVDVVVFDNRQAAEHFISLRHKGESAGAGRSEWTALQIARFDNSGLWRCLTELRVKGWLDQIVLNKIDNASFAISSFGRVANNLQFKQEFGSVISDYAFDPGPKADIALQGLAWLARDVAQELVTSRGDFETAAGAHPYIKALRVLVESHLKPDTGAHVPDGNANDTASDKSTDPPKSKTGDTGEEQEDSDTSDKANDSDKPKPPRKKRTPKYLVDKDQLTHAITHEKACALANELKAKVEVERAPLASALLIRCLLEITCGIYMREVGGGAQNNATTNIAKAAGHLLGNKPIDAPADFSEIALAFKEHGDAYAELSNIAHNSIGNFSPGHVRVVWSNIGRGLDVMWKVIQAHRANKG